MFIELIKQLYFKIFSSIIFMYFPAREPMFPTYYFVLCTIQTYLGSQENVPSSLSRSMAIVRQRPANIPQITENWREEAGGWALIGVGNGYECASSLHESQNAGFCLLRWVPQPDSLRADLPGLFIPHINTS